MPPREAARLDPQHRLALEVSWEALEDAGIPPRSLSGSATGIYFGVSSNDYFDLQARVPEFPDVYTATGGARGFLPGRISHLLNLNGPCLAVDTLCSSSLVAMHLACKGLLARECDHALVGGVNVVASPLSTVITSKFHALSATGRCKAFDAGADGFVRSEGCGVVVLRRLRDAVASGDRVLAVIRGSAVNHDGRSTGLTAPNAHAQRLLIESALRAARIEPARIGLVETHGTGTPLGDPIEVEALLATYGRSRDDGSRCALGSVKTNLGHLEAAAGIAGFIKAVLALNHASIPQNLHFQRLNPRIRLTGSALYIPTTCESWQSSATRMAAVSSFGMSGTNGHVILEEGPPRTAAAGATDRPQPLVLSARTPAALRARAAALAAVVKARPLVDLCYTAAVGRTPFEHRAALVVRDAEEAHRQLEALAAGKIQPVATVDGFVPRVAFLFTGQGSQRTGMGRELIEREPVFRATVERCDAVSRDRIGASLVDILLDESDGTALAQTRFTQPAIYALECGLYELLRSWGIEPALLLGHSVGEYAAAYAAGVFSLEEGAALIADRAVRIGNLPSGGGMAAVFAGRAELEEAMAGLEASLNVAGVNAPREVIVSGAREALDTCLERLEARGIRTRRLAVSHAFHSSAMDPILDAFEQTAAHVPFQEPRLTLISGMLGAAPEPGIVSQAGYWREQVRAPVRFADALAAAAAQGPHVFVEIGPTPVLSALASRQLRGTSASVLPSLRAPRPEERGGDDASLARLVGSLHSLGVGIDWPAVFRERGGRRTTLPPYPFERTSHWFADRSTAATRTVSEGACLSIAWQPCATSGPGSPVRGWLVVGAGSGVEELARALRAAGAKARTAPAEDAARLLTNAAAPIEGVILVLPRPSAGRRTPEEVQETAVAHAMTFVCVLRAVLEAPERPKVWLVADGAQAALEADLPDPALAATWALARCASLEHPEALAGLVDASAEVQPEAIAAWLLAGQAEPEVALRSAGALVPRLTATRQQAGEALSLDASGSYVVFGGLGALGQHVARWLLAKGATHLVLASRSAGDAPLPRELAEHGVDVKVVSADVADAAAVGALFRECNARGFPVRGVIHVAGVAQSGRVEQLDAAALAAALRPKLAGTLVLEEAAREHGVELFVCFASVAGALGASGLGAYAAANHAQDAIAQLRCARGQRALSVSWGPWASGGMADDTRTQAAERMGMRAIRPQDALAALEVAIQSRKAQVVVAAANWRTVRAAYEPRRRGALFAALASAADLSEPRRQTGAALGELSDVLRRLPGPSRLSHALALVRSHVAGVLGAAAESVDLDRGLFDAGLDSLMATELAKHLELATGLAFPATLAMDFPTVRAIAEHLLARVSGAPEPEVKAEKQALVAPTKDESIAVVGLACRMPGAPSAAAFWALLEAGADATRDLPDGRWTPTLDAPRPRGGFLDDVEHFDASFFGISPREAANMDPQQRLFLELAWEALEDAAIPLRVVRRGVTGVFAGVSVADYGRGRDLDPTYVATGTSLNVVPGRVSYALGLRGPSVAVDTACSSSLVALHLACGALRASECDVALAGGVNLILSPDGFVALSKARMLAADGRCKTFDEAADGYGRGEGGAVLVLKRLSDARAADDRILAIVRATSVNQNGPSAGLTVPSASAQEALMLGALERAGLAPRDIDFVEAHGTGTQLGDPIELQAIDAVYGRSRDASSPVLVGSVKTNIGHLESAAGIAGIAKVILALGQERLPRHVHSHHPSKRIPWDDLRVAVPSETTAWTRRVGAPRRAAVSSFGFSGTNAHAILEEAPDAGPPWKASADSPANQALALVLSARSQSALRAVAARFEAKLRQEPAIARDACFTATVTRERFEHRAAFCGATAADLLGGLRRVASGDAGGPDPLVAQVRTGAPQRATTAVLASDRPAAATAVASLLASEPGFARAFDAAEAAARPHLRTSSSIQAVLARDRGIDPLDERLADAVVAIAELRCWEVWGVTPRLQCAGGDAELVDAVVRGALGLDSALARIGADRALPESSIGSTCASAPSVAEAEAGATALRVAVGVEGDDHAPVSLLDSWQDGLLHAALARFDALAVAVDWTGVASFTAQRCALPTYPFERQRHWIARGPAQPASSTALHGARLHTAGSDVIFENQLSLSRQPWLRDHQVFGRVVVPGSFHVAVVLSMLRELNQTGDAELHDLLFLNPLTLSEHETRSLQVVVRDTEGGREVRVFSAPLDPPTEGRGEFELHAQGRLRQTLAQHHPADLERARGTLRETSATEVREADFYSRIGDGELALGPAFRWIQGIELAGDLAIAKMAAPAGTPLSASTPIAPGLIDSCFQLLAAFKSHERSVHVPVAIERVRVFGGPSSGLMALASRRAVTSSTAVADVTLVNADGRAVLALDGVTVRRAEAAGFMRAPSSAVTAFEERWRAAAPDPKPPEEGQKWLVIARDAEDPSGPALAAAFVDARTGVTLHLAGEALDDQLLTRVTGIVFLVPDGELSSATEPLELELERERDFTAQVCAELAILASRLGESASSARLWVLAHGATPGDAASPALSHAAVWGVARTLALETERNWGGVIEVHGALSESALTDSVALLRAAAPGTQRVWRDGTWLAPRLEPVDLSREPFVARTDRTYLVTGAFGGLGRSVVHWMVASGARHVAAVGHVRRDEDAAWLDGLRSRGVCVVEGYADVASPGALRDFLSRARSTLPPLAGVVHAAGVLDDGLAGSMTAQRFARVSVPKLRGAQVLDALTREEDLDFFAVFSSASAVLGSPAQSNYAAANAALDAWAKRRSEAGRRTLSLGWGPWADVGMAARTRRRVALDDLPPLEASAALAAFGRLLNTPIAHACVLAVAPGRLPARLAAHPLLASLAQEVHAAAATSPRLSNDDLRRLPRRQRQATVESALVASAARILGASDLDIAEPLARLGFDSLMAVELKNDLELQCGVVIPLATFIEGPSICELAAAACERLETRSAEAPASRRAAAPVARWEEGEL
jgi:acyl transferase domain-containing protein/acyl carrier protein